MFADLSTKAFIICKYYENYEIHYLHWNELFANYLYNFELASLIKYFFKYVLYEVGSKLIEFVII